MAALERVLALALWPWLHRRSRPGLVRAALAGLPYVPATRPSPPRVRIAVVQFDINLAPGAQAYARHAYELVQRGASAGAGLIIFPEYASLPLIGLLPAAQRLASSLAARAPTAAAQEAEHAGDEYGIIGLALRLVAPAARRVYLATFSTLAARFQVTLLAGTLIELDPGGWLCSVAYLFGPDGGLLARQMKTHLVPGEVAMGYAVGQEIVAVDTEAGRIAFPVCMDHTYFETARIAALSGADLLIDPAANMEYYNPYAQARGIWNRVQEVHTYGVLCCGVARVAGAVFEGRSGVYAPLALTPAGGGVLVEATSHDREEIILADLDYEALRAFRRQHPLEYNVELYRRYLPAVYDSTARDEAPLRGL